MDSFDSKTIDGVKTKVLYSKGQIKPAQNTADVQKALDVVEFDQCLISFSGQVNGELKHTYEFTSEQTVKFRKALEDAKCITNQS